MVETKTIFGFFNLITTYFKETNSTCRCMGFLVLFSFQIDIIELHDLILCFLGGAAGVKLLRINELTITTSGLALAFGSYFVSI